MVSCISQFNLLPVVKIFTFENIYAKYKVREMLVSVLNHSVDIIFYDLKKKYTNNVFVSIMHI